MRLPQRRNRLWNEEQRRRLIGLARQHEVLWKMVPNDQSMIRLRRNALHQIQKHFVADGFTVEHIKEQWRNLKDIFYKRYELMVKRAQRGEPPSRVRPCWSLFNDLKFLASPEAMGGRFRRGIECGTLELLEQQQFGELEQVDEGENSWQDGGDEMDDTGEVLAGIDPDIVAISVKLEEALDEQQQLPHQHGIHRNVHEIAAADSITQQQPMEMSSMARLNRSIDRSIRAASRVQRAPQRPRAQVIQQSMSSSGSEWSERPGPSSALNNQSFMADNPALANGKEKPSHGHQDRFQHFGTFVESAVRDLHQQSPKLALRLVQNIYSNIAQTQMEATNSEWVIEGWLAKQK